VLVALLVVAGGIGFLANGGRVGSSQEALSGATTFGSDSGGAQENVPAAVPSPMPRSAKDALQFGSATDRSGGGARFDQNSSAANATTDLSKIVRDGTITVVVAKDGFTSAFESTTGIADELGGFVLASSISQERAGTLTLRIPAKRLDAALVRVGKLGRIAEQTTTGKDVTANFVDLKSRLSVYKTRRALIVKLLNASNSINEQLGLQHQFDDVQLSIEQIQGQLNVLNDQVALATLKVSIREEGVSAVEPSGVDTPSLGSAWDHAVAGFLGVVAAVVVGLGYLVPILLIAGAAYGIVTLVRRRRRADSVPSAA
jgi:hypothetical protein